MRILIVNVNWIGDILFSTFLIRCIKKSFPNSYLLTLVPENGAKLLEGNPYLDGIIEFDPFSERGFTGFDISLIRKLRSYNFSHSLHLHRSLSRKCYAYFGGIKNRIGYNEKLNSFLLTQSLTSQRDRVHRALYYFNLGSVINIADDSNGLDIFIRDEELERAREVLASHKIDRFCLMHIGANWQAKRWPFDYYSELINLIINKYNIKVLLTGTGQDVQGADYIVAHSNPEVLSLAGKTTLRELISLIKLSQVSITVDSAPLHIAAAFKKPLIGIFGPTDDKLTGPFRPEGKTIILKENIDCSIPCYKDICPYDYICMRKVKPQSVLNAVGKVLR
ncbi:MAG: lipopolysaccharide heptosyltransferase II [Candidatus Kaelpia imicola]|nr:lipopolysaccharide heptosyltransferase II [Candidatus Kaelpia imicola]